MCNSSKYVNVCPFIRESCVKIIKRCYCLKAFPLISTQTCSSFTWLLIRTCTHLLTLSYSITFQSHPFLRSAPKVPGCMTTHSLGIYAVNQHHLCRQAQCPCLCQYLEQLIFTMHHKLLEIWLHSICAEHMCSMHRHVCTRMHTHIHM